MWKPEEAELIEALVNYAPQLLPKTPCSLNRLATFLAARHVGMPPERIAEHLLMISKRVPNTLIIENESEAGHFLVFYHVKALEVLCPFFSGKNKVKYSNADDLKTVDSIVPDASSRKMIHGYRCEPPFSALEQLKASISELTNKPTYLEETARENLKKTLDQIPSIEICDSESYSQCKAADKSDCSTKIHFEKVFTPNCDPTLGDCSYLDTCFKGKQCKYVHYRIRFPQVPPLVSKAKNDLFPAQHINANLLQLDFARLGNDYKAMIIDPPWDIHTKPGVQGGCSDADILALPIEKLQRNGVVFLWVTGRVLDFGRQCLTKWGYCNIEELIWLKTNQLGRTICTGRTGHWLNHTKEHVLVGTKGQVDISSCLDTDVIVSNALGKSQKPEELYGIIDRLVGPGAKKLELFGRKSNVRPGWLTVGNELGSTHLVDPQLRAQLLAKSLAYDE